jgi:magnesium-transporting ATPase (P-type)
VRARPGDADGADGRTGRGAQLGSLIKGPEVLEQNARIDTIVLDKTGTVTEGKIELADVVLLDGATRAMPCGWRGPSRRQASIRSGARSHSLRGPRSARFHPSRASATVRASA